MSDADVAAVSRSALEVRANFQKLVDCYTGDADALADREEEDVIDLSLNADGRDHAPGEPSIDAPLTGKQRLARLPNIHVGRHLGNAAQRFGTLMNVCASAGEERHKTAKRAADRTTSYAHDAIWQIMLRDNVNRSLLNLSRISRLTEDGGDVQDERARYFVNFVTRHRTRLPLLLNPPASRSRRTPEPRLKSPLTERERLLRDLPDPRLEGTSVTTMRSILAAYHAIGKPVLDLRGSLQYGNTISDAKDGPLIATGRFMRLHGSVVKVLAVALHRQFGELFALVQRTTKSSATDDRLSLLQPVTGSCLTSVYTLNGDTSWYHFETMYAADRTFEWLHAIPLPDSMREDQSRRAVRSVSGGEVDDFRPVGHDATFFINDWTAVNLH